MSRTCRLIPSWARDQRNDLLDDYYVTHPDRGRQLSLARLGVDGTAGDRRLAASRILLDIKENSVIEQPDTYEDYGGARSKKMAALAVRRKLRHQRRQFIEAE